MHLAAAVDDASSHALDDDGQFVGTDMRMGVGEDRGVGAMLAEDGEDTLCLLYTSDAADEL